MQNGADLIHILVGIITLFCLNAMNSLFGYIQTSPFWLG